MDTLTQPAVPALRLVLVGGSKLDRALRAALAALNPLLRVPALVLPDGFVLTDSHMILDYLDGMAAAPLLPRHQPRPSRLLLPPRSQQPLPWRLRRCPRRQTRRCLCAPPGLHRVWPN